MTYLDFLKYLDENIGVKHHIMFRKFEGPSLPEAVNMGIQKDRLKDIRAYVQPRGGDALNEMEIIYFMNESKINDLRILTEKYFGLDNNWKHPEILDCDVSTTLHKLYKPSDIVYQIIKIKFQWEVHLKSIVIEKLQSIGNVNLMNENEFDYQTGLEENYNLLILVKENENDDQLTLRFLCNNSSNIAIAISSFENLSQHLIRRVQGSAINEIDFGGYKGVDYTYSLI